MAQAAFQQVSARPAPVFKGAVPRRGRGGEQLGRAAPTGTRECRSSSTQGRGCLTHA